MPVTFFTKFPFTHEIVIALAAGVGFGDAVFLTVPCADMLVADAAEDDSAS